MDPSNQDKQQEVEEPRFLHFPHLPNGVIQDGMLRLNRYSSTITKGHDFPGAQVSFGPQKKGSSAHFRAGNAVRCRRTGPTVNEEQPACWRGFGMVGGQSMQVRDPGFGLSCHS